MPTTKTTTLALAIWAAASAASAEIAVSANDGKQALINGVVGTPAEAVPDSVSVIQLDPAPRLIATVPVPTSLTGPPTSVAVAPDESFALVTASRRFEAGGRTTLVPNDTLTVIALKGGAPRVVASHQTGAGASGVSINPAGTLALVVNKVEGSVSAFAIRKGVLTPKGKVQLGAAASPSHVVFFDKGRRAVVTRSGDGLLSVLRVGPDGASLEPQSVTLAAGAGSLDSVGPRKFAAAVAGGSLFLVDLSGPAPRLSDTAAIAPTPEAVKMSPNGKFVAVNSHNGSGAVSGAPGYNADGLLQIFRIEAGKLVKVVDAPVAAWGQGMVWTRDSKRLVLHASKDNRVDIYRFDGAGITRTASLPAPATPAGLRTAER